MRRFSSLMAILLMFASVAQAQGIYGTGASFANSSVCINYGCKLQSRTGNGAIWIYRTKFGDNIGIVRATSAANSAITAIIVTIPDAEAKYLPSDRGMTDALQKLMYGKVIESLPEECYWADEPMRFGVFQRNGVTKYLGCGMLPDGSMVVGLGGNL